MDRLESLAERRPGVDVAGEGQAIVGIGRVRSRLLPDLELLVLAAAVLVAEQDPVDRLLRTHERPEPVTDSVSIQVLVRKLLLQLLQNLLVLAEVVDLQVRDVRDALETEGENYWLEENIPLSDKHKRHQEE